MHDLHLVAGDSAAETLRYAIENCGLLGSVFCIPDSYNVGPLTDGHERKIFWKSLGTFYEEDGHQDESDDDIFSYWRVLIQHIEHTPPKRIIIWTSEHSADYIFLRMACHRLSNAAIPLWCVQVPANNVAVHTPEAMTIYVANAVTLSDAQRKAYAQEYEKIIAHPEMVRICDASGYLSFHDISYYDQLLINACKPEWQSAARVVGQAMGNCDPRNGVGDAFLHHRLQPFITNGTVEADKTPTAMRNYRVRLVTRS